MKLPIVAIGCVLLTLVGCTENSPPPTSEPPPDVVTGAIASIMRTYNHETYAITSAQKAPNPEIYASRVPAAEIWCIVIEPAVTDVIGASNVKNFLVIQSNDRWNVTSSSRSRTDEIGCTNWSTEGSIRD